jgi:hypothetical protein
MADKTIEKEPIFSLDKLLTEGIPSETKMILGWVLNTRDLSIRLPKDKLSVWDNDLALLIQKNSRLGKS